VKRGRGWGGGRPAETSKKERILVKKEGGALRLQRVGVVGKIFGVGKKIRKRDE